MELTPVTTGTSALYTSNPNIIKSDRIGIAVTPAEPNSIYLIYGQVNNGTINGYFHKSTDGGVTWQTAIAITTTNVSYYDYMPDVGYYGCEFEISPKYPNVFYMGNKELFKSTDAGANWLQITDYYSDTHNKGGHADIRALAIRDNFGTDNLLMGNDGGVGYSTSSGNTWTNVSKTLPISEFLSLAVTEANPNLMVAGAPDNGMWTYNSGTWAYSVQLIGDAYECAIDYQTPPNCYGEANGSALQKSINGNNNWFGITNPPGTTNLVSPLYAHPTNNTIYSGRHDVFKSSTSSISWTRISDFTTKFNPGVSAGGLVALAIAPSNTNVIYAAYPSTCGGNCITNPIKSIFRTTVGGGVNSGNWVDITGNFPPSNIFKWLSITSIDVNPVNEAELWVTVGGFSYGERVYHSSNYGNTWVDYSNNLPQFPANKIVCANGATGDLYLATDVGVFYTNNAIYPSQGWTCFSNNFPVVITTDLEVNKCTGIIRASTIGRGIWESPLAPSSRIISVAVSQNPICLTQTANLTVNLPSATSTYKWYDAVTGGNLLGTGTSFITPILSATTTFYVEEINSFCTSPRTAVVVNFKPVPPDDLYIKDTPTDDGTEPNANQPWLLVDGTDIWTRNTADGGTQHQSPEFTGAWATNPATRPVIYTKVRNRGCSTVTEELHLYYHKFTTNDHWNTCNASNLCGSWEEILCGDINGNALIDGAETACSNIITLASGQEVTVSQVWNNVAQTAIFTDPIPSGSRQEWCLLARLVSAADPINGELLGVSAANNAKASNNIVQKNVTIVNNTPGIICNPFDFGNVSLARSINQLNIIDASATPFNGTEGLITIDLGKSLYDAWVQGGKQGTGIIEGRNKYNHMSATGVIHNHSPLTLDANPYKINLTSSTSSLRNISLPPQIVVPVCPMFNYNSGPASTIPFEYYFVQFESLNNSPMNYTGAVKYYINKPECPNVNAGADVTIGRQCSTILTASPIIAGATYVWRNNNTGVTIGTGSSISISPNVSTTYELEVNTPNRCIDYDIVTVTVNPQISCQIVSCPVIEFKNRTLTKSETISGREVAVEGVLRIPNNKTLTIDNSTVNLMKDAQIEVMQGGRLEIINSELRGCSPIDKWKGMVVKGNNTDIHQIKITGSTIRDAVAPLMATSVSGLYVEASTFEYAATAIEISASKDFKIKSNQFYATETAIKTNGTLAGTASVIEKNYITNAKTAISLNAGNHSKLSMSCNTFDAYTDYAIYSNNTILATQGTITEGTGNTFVSGSTLLNNKLRHNGNAMTYYYDPSVPVALSSGSGLTAVAAPSQQDATCYSAVARNSLVQAGIPIKDAKAYKLYPNPNNGSMNFEYQLSETETGSFIIYDVSGRKVANYLLEQSKTTMTINESDLTNGLYFYSVIVNGKVAASNKIVIIK